MLPKRPIALLILASLSAGCAVGPDYTQPDTPLPEQYLGQAAVDRRHAAASADLVAWWAGVEDPQLTRCVTLALQQNIELVLNLSQRGYVMDKGQVSATLDAAAVSDEAALIRYLAV